METRNIKNCRECFVKGVNLAILSIVGIILDLTYLSIYLGTTALSNYIHHVKTFRFCDIYHEALQCFKVSSCLSE